MDTLCSTILLLTVPSCQRLSVGCPDLVGLGCVWPSQKKPGCFSEAFAGSQVLENREATVCAGPHLHVEKEKNTQLKRRMEELEAELREKGAELEDLRSQSELTPQLRSERDCVSEQTEAAEKVKTWKTKRVP
ncbi:hypothetical protein H8959_016518 [Pygathrix nigripes]